MTRLVWAVLVACIGCAGQPARVAAPVLMAAGQVNAVSLVDIHSRQEVATFNPEEVDRFNQLLGRIEESTGYVATTPPWDTAIILHTANDATVVTHFVGTALRFSRLKPWSNGAMATDPEWEAASVDLDLHYDDGQWLWNTLSSHLGASKVKEYKPLLPLP